MRWEEYNNELVKLKGLKLHLNFKFEFTPYEVWLTSLPFKQTFIGFRKFQISTNLICQWWLAQFIKSW